MYLIMCFANWVWLLCLFFFLSCIFILSSREEAPLVLLCRTMSLHRLGGFQFQGSCCCLKSCPRKMLLVWVPPSRDKHREASHPRRYNTHDEGSGWTRDVAILVEKITVSLPLDHAVNMCVCMCVWYFCTLIWQYDLTTGTLFENLIRTLITDTHRSVGVSQIYPETLTSCVLYQKYLSMFL